MAEADAEIFAREADLSIRRMGDEADEYACIVRWRNSPHVREWWDPDDPPLTLETARAKYWPRAAGDEDTTACIIVLDSRSIGYVQFYPWNPFDEDAKAMGWAPGSNWWGIDIFIGEVEDINRGIGTRAVSLLCQFLVRERHASTVALTCSRQNLRAIRCYEKAGFYRHSAVLDTDLKDGQRVQSWLMVWSPGD